MANLVLASGSVIRAKILTGAGLPFEIAPANIDETALIEAGVRDGTGFNDLACLLAEEKAQVVSKQQKGVVIGADQILGFEGRPYEKCETMEEAKQRLTALAGKAHFLHCGIALAEGGKIIWRHGESSKMTMRDLTEAEIDAYLETVGPKVLSSVGAYYIEEHGVRLFSAMAGNHFAILGLPLLPLLAALRERGVVAW
jgi:nucleoside triphosphate pyrophosphatase